MNRWAWRLCRLDGSSSGRLWVSQSDLYPSHWFSVVTTSSPVRGAFYTISLLELVRIVTAFRSIQFQAYLIQPRPMPAVIRCEASNLQYFGSIIVYPKSLGVQVHLNCRSFRQEILLVFYATLLSIDRSASMPMPVSTLVNGLIERRDAKRI
jgi:hypothetical protein